MTADITVRKFESSDVDSVIALWNKALPSSQLWNEPKDVICRKLNVNDGRPVTVLDPKREASGGGVFLAH